LAGQQPWPQPYPESVD